MKLRAEMRPPPDEIFDWISYDPDTGIFTRIKRPRNGKGDVGDRADTMCPKGYMRVKFKREYYAAHRLAWLFVHGDWPDLYIDHINRTPADNRIENLRLADTYQNAWNSDKGADAGIRPRSDGAFVVELYHKSKFLRFGPYKGKAAARSARRVILVALRGEFTPEAHHAS